MLEATAVSLPVARASLQERLPTFLKSRGQRFWPCSHLGQVPSTVWAQVYFQFLPAHSVHPGLEPGLETWGE